MVIDIIPRHTDSSIVIFRPAHDWNAWDLFDMLHAAFPVYLPNGKFTQFNFNICCVGGYENAIMFD